MPTGHTKDAGWQIGVSRTLRHPPEEVWELLTSPDGLSLWLGEGAEIIPERGTPWTAADGSHGEVRSFHPGDRIRVTCQPTGWDHETTVQVVVVPASDHRASVRFHQERLADSVEREQQRTHWRDVMDRLEDALDAGARLIRTRAGGGRSNPVARHRPAPAGDDAP